MNNHLRGVAAAVLATFAVGYSIPSLAAQDAVTGRATVVNSEGQVTHCVSTESGRTYCGHPHMRYTMAGAAPTECVQGKTWGFDDRGVWVTGGCKADFNTLPGNTVTSRTTKVNSAGEVVHCVGTANGRSYCGVAHKRYVIVGTPPATCVENTTWGMDDEHGVWVTGGCKADFRLDDSE